MCKLQLILRQDLRCKRERCHSLIRRTATALQGLYDAIYRDEYVVELLLAEPNNVLWQHIDAVVR
jgi:hypothetical protein